MKRYYSVCRMMWVVLSSFHYIFEESLDDAAKVRLQSWSIQREDAANWLMTEAEKIVENQEISNASVTGLDKSLEEAGDKLTIYAADKIKSAREIIVINELSKDEVALYHYMRWLSTTLNDLVEVESHESKQSEEFYSSGMLLNLRQLVGDEIQKIDSLSISELRESGDRLSLELFRYWKSLITSM